MTRIRIAVLFAALLAIGAVGVATAPPASARVFIGFGFAPWWWGPYPYPYAYPYYPPYANAPGPYAPGPYAPGYDAAPAPVAPAPAATANWYWCGNPRGYYPYVKDCSVAWRQVPARPSQP
jgi:hypothetical protein